MDIRKTKLLRFFASVKFTIWILALLAVFSALGTLIPQGKPVSLYIAKYGHFACDVFLKTGLTGIYSSWWFAALFVLLAVNLMACIISRFSPARSPGTLISHVGMIVILAGALIGMLWGMSGFMEISEGESVNSFMPTGAGKDGCCPAALDFSLRLDDFIYEENISPGEKLSIYSYSGDFIMEAPVEMGKEINIPGTGNNIKIVRYVPDFVMDTSTNEVTTRSAEGRNPAIQLELGDGKAQRTFWVFANYPDVHKTASDRFLFKYEWQPRRPKDFISKITVIKDGKEVKSKEVRVNSPLKFCGYVFFQSTYDAVHHKWTGLKVVKDPGVPVVYLGFFLLILGLTISFYVNPALRK